MMKYVLGRGELHPAPQPSLCVSFELPPVCVSNWTQIAPLGLLAVLVQPLCWLALSTPRAHWIWDPAGLSPSGGGRECAEHRTCWSPACELRKGMQDFTTVFQSHTAAASLRCTSTSTSHEQKPGVPCSGMWLVVFHVAAVINEDLQAGYGSGHMGSRQRRAIRSWFAPPSWGWLKRTVGNVQVNCLVGLYSDVVDLKCWVWIWLRIKEQTGRKK